MCRTGGSSALGIITAHKIDILNFSATLSDMVFFVIPHFETAIHTPQQSAKQARLACTLDCSRLAVLSVNLNTGVPGIRINNRFVGIFHLNPFGFRFINLLVVFVGNTTSFVLHHMPDIHLVANHLLYGDIIPQMIAVAYALPAIFKIVVIPRL